jgi:hypothetical protein
MPFAFTLAKLFTSGCSSHAMGSLNPWFSDSTCSARIASGAESAPG